MLKKLYVGIAVAVSGVAQAGYTSFDISGLTNLDASTLTQGGDYPTFPGGYTIGSIPFVTSSNPFSGPGEGVILLGPNYQGGPSINSATVAINQTGIQSVYTLINSAFGSQNTHIGDVTFIGTAGNFTTSLIEGKNVRDHYFGNFVNSVVYGINSTTFWNAGVTTSTGGLGSVRNDVQGWSIPASIGDLLSVQFTYTGTGNQFDGTPLVFGLTTSTEALVGTNSNVPSPAAAIPFVVGLISVRRRNRRA